jgi:hypothetical protein
MAKPPKIWLYRITHMENMEHDLLHGLHIANSPSANPNYCQIGDSTLITYRKELSAPDPPGGTLADYIPFYLAHGRRCFIKLHPDGKTFKNFHRRI